MRMRGGMPLSMSPCSTAPRFPCHCHDPERLVDVVAQHVPVPLGDLLLVLVGGDDRRCTIGEAGADEVDDDVLAPARGGGVLDPEVVKHSDPPAGPSGRVA